MRFYTLFKNNSFYNEFCNFAIEVSVFTMNLSTCLFVLHLSSNYTVFTMNSASFPFLCENNSFYNELSIFLQEKLFFPKTTVFTINYALFFKNHSFYNELYTVQLGAILGPFWHREGSMPEPSRAEPSRAGPGRAEPSRAEPSRADGPGRAETAPDGPRTTLQTQFFRLRARGHFN